MKCYTYKKIISNYGLYDDSIDSTYIIHLENNGRLDNVMKQINKYMPTKIVYIVFNKGYKNCNKDNYINTPPLDLVNAFLEIFNHAKKENYNNILVLEDDFIFNENTLDDNIMINKNINSKNNEFVYFLGCLPILQFPCSLTEYTIKSSIGTHSIVYSKEFREKTLQIEKQKFTDWDYYIGFCGVTRYLHYRPIYYQIFLQTENSKYWSTDLFFVILKYFIKLFKIDKNPEPGYIIFYTCSKIFILILFICFILFIKKMKFIQ